MWRRSEVEAMGMTGAQIDQRCREGVWEHVRHGVVGVPEPNLDLEQRHRRLIHATWAGLRPGAVISHASAAVLHGLPVPAAMLQRVWITRPGRSGRISHLLHLCRAELADEEVVEVDGLPTTSRVRTCLDLTRRLMLTEGVILADAALHTTRAQPASDPANDDIRAELLESVRRGVWGDARATRTLRFADGRSESPGESRSRMMMHRLGIELPDLQVEVFDEDGLAGRSDFGWRSRRLLGEYDGVGKYLRDLRPGENPADVVWREKRREDRLRRTGHGVVRWTKAELANPPAFRRLLLGALNDHRVLCEPPDPHAAS